MNALQAQSAARKAELQEKEEREGGLSLEETAELDLHPDTFDYWKQVTLALYAALHRPNDNPAEIVAMTGPGELLEPDGTPEREQPLYNALLALLAEAQAGETPKAEGD